MNRRKFNIQTKGLACWRTITTGETIVVAHRRLIYRCLRRQKEEAEKSLARGAAMLDPSARRAVGAEFGLSPRKPPLEKPDQGSPLSWRRFG